MKFFLKIVFVLVLFSTPSCKIKYSLSGASIPVEAQTVSVAFFTNNTTLGSPTLAQRFTEKLRDVVSSQTRLGLVSQNGDLQFEGSIADYNVSPVAIQSTDLAGLNRLTITVNVKYNNKFDAGKNFEQNFTRFADYKSTENINDKEAELVQEIYRQLTEDVFNRAFNNW
ncbi:MAG: LptE family protein [Sphingobacteriaceae bacterium]|nr:LptE family protein [Sphingobacteriaceae bacterium]